MHLRLRTARRTALAALMVCTLVGILAGTASAKTCAMNPGANCAGMDLRGYNMDGMDLTGMNMAGANMSGMKIKGANMTGANLKGAKMSGMTLTDMTMDKANMSGTDLSTTKIHRGTYRGTKFTSSNFRKIRIIGADFSSANFTRISNGTKPQASTRGWETATNNYVNGVQGGSYVSGANFSGAIFNYAAICSTTFNNVRWQWATIASSAICGSTFTGNNTYFETVTIVGSDFWHTDFHGTMWASKNVVNSDFNGAYCDGLTAGHTQWGSTYGAGNININEDRQGTCDVKNGD